ncbi:hypothetical protein CPB84DRAFT_1842498 [Gymnopilus junonius]|uniref:Uncharacterized protein n=1 Tax=Gymnopilus junonius TaxID=109634 RepID=A0A9P5TT21_GYMJU|nr:hypothetical protein CPB84DRAFT_1842498 [Gymnopilus junonius]
MVSLLRSLMVLRIHATHRWQNASKYTRRRWTFCGVTGFLTIFLFLYSLSNYGQQHIQRLKEIGSSYRQADYKPPVVDSTNGDEPPSWEKLRKWELDLPQHDLDLPYPEGRTGRYIYFRNQIQYLGWNNQLNEVLMNTFLAYKSKRTYVFQDYHWKVDYYPWPESQVKDWPLRTPANALISGPSVGGPWDPEDPAPRSVSDDWWDTVCPEKERRIINTREVKPAIMWENGEVIFNHWVKLLGEATDRCIEIQAADREEDGFPQVFDLFLWGSDRILPLWESFRDSPVSRLLGTSPIVEAAVAKNEYLFVPRGPRPSVPAARNPFDRMFAVHLRRGDYKDACLGFANWNSTFYSWNLLPFLPDRFINPPGYTWGTNTPENVEFFLKHCLPSDASIVEQVNNARSEYAAAGKPGEHRYLDVLFLLTNDKTSWVDGLKAMFKKHGWHTIVTTSDLELDPWEKDVGMAVDMEIARRAAVFLGNGWSSFTSNINHRRLVDGKEPISIRFY